jgi:hypothetical protein
VSVRPAGGEVLVEFVDITPEGGAGIQTKPVAVDKNRVFAEGGSKGE